MRQLALVSFALLLGGMACRPQSSATAPRGGGQLSPPDAAGRIDRVVKRLRDPDERVRDAAQKELEALVEAGISDEQGVLLLRAATGPFPSRKPGLGSTEASLIDAASSRPSMTYIPVVKEIFPALQRGEGAMSGDARASALELLSEIDDESAAVLLLDLLEGAIAAGSPPPVHFHQLEETPRFPEVFFPRILRSAKGEAREGVFSLCLAYAVVGAVSPRALEPHAGVVTDAFEALRAPIAAAQAKGGAAWVWDESYGPVRFEAGVVLDLMGFFPAPEVTAVLREAVKLTDPELVYFAALSLLRHGRSVAPGVFEFIAASAERRGSLFEKLEELELAYLFPTRWATQPALAESEMVRWLTYPTELGRGPDEIELMEVIVEDVGPPDGVLEWYLFRFRTHAPHWAAKDGWMAGVAGPFHRADAPSARAYGDTFSTFTKWDAHTPEEHVAAVRETIAAAWRKRAEGESKP